MEHSADSNAWIIDGTIGKKFHDKLGRGAPTNSQKKLLKATRDAAIRDGLVEAGRLHNLAREVVPVRTAYVADLTEEQKQHLSTTADGTALFIRITDKGRFRLHPDWTPSA